VIKLYRSAKYPMHWFAYSPQERWVKFPAQIGGWEQRQQIGNGAIEQIEMRQIPLWLGFNTGIPGAPHFAMAVAKVMSTAA
jgi:hypothetical protein